MNNCKRVIILKYILLNEFFMLKYFENLTYFQWVANHYSNK